MDEGTIPTALLNCCICDGPDTPTQKQLLEATLFCKDMQKLLEM